MRCLAMLHRIDGVSRAINGNKTELTDPKRRRQLVCYDNTLCYPALLPNLFTVFRSA
jgi:hypothetical protein